jgi:hypothetical protein
MQFRKPFKAQIRAGRVTCSIRTWQRPQARVGGRYNLHPEGAIEVTAVRQLPLSRVSAGSIRASGFSDRAALRTFLGAKGDPLVYQVDFRYLGGALVKVPDRGVLSNEELLALLGKLAAMDARSKAPWTTAVLVTLDERPGTRAADLAAGFGWETAVFKAQVRKLKALGLSISLGTGYELSARGRQVLTAALERRESEAAARR